MIVCQSGKMFRAMSPSTTPPPFLLAVMSSHMPIRLGYVTQIHFRVTTPGPGRVATHFRRNRNFWEISMTDIDRAGKNGYFPARQENFQQFFFFHKKCEISLKMPKFHGKEPASFPTFYTQGHRYVSKSYFEINVCFSVTSFL